MPGLNSSAPAPAASSPAATASGAAAPAASAGAGTTSPAASGQKAPGPYTPNGSATVTGDQASIQALDTLKWQPNTLTVSPGAKVTLQVQNTGNTAHSFIGPALGVSTAKPIATGATTPVSFTAPNTAGTYQFWCDIPGHAEAGMVGEVIVK